jgi:hypothetical protein
MIRNNFGMCVIFIRNLLLKCSAAVVKNMSLEYYPNFTLTLTNNKNKIKIFCFILFISCNIPYRTQDTKNVRMYFNIEIN